MRLLTVLVATAVIALLAAGLQSAESANSASFTDPTGDFVGGSPDITGVSIANDDNGLVTVKIQLAASRPLGSGMRTGVLFDTDANASTGAPGYLGAEVAMQLDISANDWAYYRWNDSISDFEHVNSTTGSITFTSDSTTIKINRSELGNTSKINFYVFGDWEKSTDVYDTDWAPADGGSWQYNVVVATTTTTTTGTTTTTTTTTTNPTTTAPTTTTNPTTTTPKVTIADVLDRDGDTVPDQKDGCPATRGGPYDTNKNGCPGPFRAIKVPTGDNLRPTSSSGEITTYEPPRNTIRGLPPDAQVLLRYGAQRERLRADKAGTVKSQLLLRNDFRHGAKVEIWAWKPGWIGYGVQLIVRTKPPYAAVVNRRCIPATGSAVPRPCNRVSRGR